MRKEYEMSDADLNELLESMKPQPVMYGCGGVPLFQSVRERANAAWKRLGDRIGFDYLSVQPTGKGDRFFSAEPKENV